MSISVETLCIEAVCHRNLGMLDCTGSLTIPPSFSSNFTKEYIFEKICPNCLKSPKMPSVVSEDVFPAIFRISWIWTKGWFGWRSFWGCRIQIYCRNWRSIIFQRMGLHFKKFEPNLRMVGHTCSPTSPWCFSSIFLKRNCFFERIFNC